MKTTRAIVRTLVPVILVLGLGLSPLVGQASLVSADSSECSVMRSHSTSSSERYNVCATCFTSSGWAIPVPATSDGYLITSTNYDYDSPIYLSNHGFRHGGVDFVGPYDSPYDTSTPVYAIGAGTIRHIVWDDNTTANNSRVHIEHTSANGVKFLAIYGHTYAPSNLSVGDVVSLGQHIGTLRQYGSPMHLHFELNTVLSTTSYGAVKVGTVNPVQFLLDNPASGSASELTMVNCYSHKFPFIYLTVRVSRDGQPVNHLTKEHFSVTEDGRLQMDMFDVVPPAEGGGVRMADIVFLIDTSGSMGGQIAAVRDNCVVFADALAASDIDYRLGLVEFGQSAGGGHPRIIGSGLTASSSEFQSWVAALYTSGRFEPGFAAIRLAIQSYNFRPGAQKVFILITDEDSDCRDKQTTIDMILANDVTVHVAARCSFGTSESDYCGPGSVRDVSGGLLFPVNGDYRSILDTIGEAVAASYIVRYRTDNPALDGSERSVVCIVQDGAATYSVQCTYVAGGAPQIQRTEETLKLHEQSLVAASSPVISVIVTDAAPPFVQDVFLYLRTSGSSTGYAQISMSPQGNDIYSTAVPVGHVDAPGFDYYIRATDGQVTSSDPTTDPDTNPYQLAVFPNEAPVIVHTPPATWQAGSDVSLDIGASDSTYGVESVEVCFREQGALLWQSVSKNYDPIVTSMSESFLLPVAAWNTQVVEYYIKVTDDLGVHRFAPEGGADSPYTLSSGNTAPVALAESMSVTTKRMYPNIPYTVAAAYHDLDGMEDLKFCYLRLNHPTKPLTLMWNRATDEYWAWAGEEGANYVTVTGFTVPMYDTGYDLNWQFILNEEWPQVENAIDFGILAMDIQGATSGWDYANANASFISEVTAAVITSPLEITPAGDTYYGGDTVTAKFTVTNRREAPVTFDTLVVGGRDPNGEVVDFDGVHDIVLNPDESYSYEQNLTLPNIAGDYHFFVAYQLPDGNWVLDIDAEIDGQMVVAPDAAEFRVRDICVVWEGYTDPPSPALWTEIKGPWSGWGQRLARVAIHPNNPQVIFAVVEHHSLVTGHQGDKLYRSLNGGRTWVQADKGLPGAFLSEYRYPITAIAIAPSSPNTVYLGTSHIPPENPVNSTGEGVYKSTDGGLTWKEAGGPHPGGKLRQHFAISAITVHPSNPDTVYVGTYREGIWKTTKGGGQRFGDWRRVRLSAGDMCRMVNGLGVDPADPEVVYAASHNFDFFGPMVSQIPLCPAAGNLIVRSENGGTNWQDLSSLDVSGAIADMEFDPRDSSLLYVVTSRFRVYAYRHTLETWVEASGNGGRNPLPSLPFGASSIKASIALDPDIPGMIYAGIPRVSGMEDERWVSRGRAVYFSPDGGSNWFASELQKDAEQLIFSSDETSRVLHAAGRNGLFRVDLSEGMMAVRLNSPGELRVYDYQGRVTGLENGQIKGEIPYSVYDDANNTITIIHTTDYYRYEVVGTDSGTYGLMIAYVGGSSVSSFVAASIPIAPGVGHAYVIDWDALARGEKGVTAQTDSDGDGEFERTFTIGNTLAAVQTGTGRGTAFFAPSDGFIENLETLPVPPEAPAGVTFPYGMFSFQVTGLDPGETVTLTIELPEPVPGDTVWWKYHDGTWHDLPISIVDTHTITLELTDGVFPGDIDGEVDGTITDPGGPGNPVPASVTLPVGGTGHLVNRLSLLAPWITLLAAMAGASLLILKRRQAQS